MQYPLNLSFKIMALAPQLSVTDASGNLVMYVKQKLFKLKEAVTVFSDREQNHPLFMINADRIIDFSARYNFADSSGKALGAVKRQGLRSIWKSHYNVFDGEQHVMTIQEENPWVKVLDSVFEGIPVIGMFSGYVLHPAYIVSDTAGTPVMKLKKMPAFLEGKFSVEKYTDLQPEMETRILLALMMMVLLERSKG